MENDAAGIEIALFEEALGEILLDDFEGRSRWDFTEAQTYRLHELTRKRISDKHADLYPSKVLTKYYASAQRRRR
jgi:hypothetical protein